MHRGMVRLHDEEPRFGPGESVPISDVVEALRHTRQPQIGPFLLAIDGRSSSGKSVLASRLSDVVERAFVVDTDDIAWHHGFFDWEGLLVDGVLDPVARGAAVSFRPPAWVERGREGAVEVPAGTTAVFVED